jgi:hypothetical protein
MDDEIEQLEGDLGLDIGDRDAFLATITREEAEAVLSRFGPATADEPTLEAKSAGGFPKEEFPHPKKKLTIRGGRTNTGGSYRPNQLEQSQFFHYVCENSMSARSTTDTEHADPRRSHSRRRVQGHLY